ncbi:hypothetical protein [Arthrobacter sp. USHLN218]|uniref:hypothetical protein n=1 Tax=Arthrobacter sp. USHLN218 TaxID=3081232 RepID=UPI00301984A1
MSQEAEPGMREVVRMLTDALGQTVVAALTGNRVKLTANDGVLEDGPEPDADAAERLRCAVELWNLLAEARGEDSARSWFVDSSQLLGDEPPATAIREGRFDEVRRAARAYLE